MEPPTGLAPFHHPPQPMSGRRESSVNDDHCYMATPPPVILKAVVVPTQCNPGAGSVVTNLLVIGSAGTWNDDPAVLTPYGALRVSVSNPLTGPVDKASSRAAYRHRRAQLGRKAPRRPRS